MPLENVANYSALSMICATVLENLVNHNVFASRTKCKKSAVIYKVFCFWKSDGASKPLQSVKKYNDFLVLLNRSDSKNLVNCSAFLRFFLLCKSAVFCKVFEHVLSNLQ